MTQTPDICESIRLAEGTAGPRGNRGSEGGNIETSSTSPWFHIFRGLDGVVREYLRLQSIAAAVLLCSDKLPKFLQRINTSDITHNPNFGQLQLLSGRWVSHPMVFPPLTVGHRVRLPLEGERRYKKPPLAPLCRSLRWQWDTWPDNGKLGAVAAVQLPLPVLTHHTITLEHTLSSKH